MRRPTLAGLLLSFAAALPAQVVPVTGGGAALQQAIAAAPTGAVLLVDAGLYDGFVITVDKDLTIIGPAAVVVGDVHLNVPAASGRRIAVRGLGVTADWSIGQPGTFHSNADLFLDDVDFDGLRVTSNSPRPTVYVRGATIESATMFADCAAVDSSFVGGVDGGFGESGLAVTGSLRAERVVVRGGAGSLASGLGLIVNGDATIADSVVEGAPDPSGLGVTWALYNQSGSVTVSGTVIASSLNPFTTRDLATVRLNGDLRIGLVSTYEVTAPPVAAVAVVLATDLVPWTSPFAMEQLWVGATNDYALLAIGLSSASGAFQSFLSLPIAPVLQHSQVWLTGVVFDPLPMRTSAPVGGMIR